MDPHASNPLDQSSAFARVRRIFGYAWPYRGKLALAGVCLAIGSGLGLVYPRYFGAIIDAAFTRHDVGALNRHTVVLVAIFALQAVFVFFRHFWFSWVGERVVADLRVELYRHLMSLSQAYFHRKRSGELLSRLSEDVSKLHGTVSSDVSMAARNLVTLLGGVAILLWSNAYLTSIMLAVVPPLVVATVYFGRKIRKLARRAQDELARANGHLQEGLSGIETVQAFTREDYEVERYGMGVTAAFKLFIRKVVASSWFMSTSSFVAFTAIAGIFWLGGTMVAEDRISAGELTEFMLYTMLVAGAVGATAGLWSNVQAAIGASTRIFEILDTRPDVVSSAGAKAPTALHGDLRFEKVGFTYADRDAQVLHDIDLHVRPGESCALVGPSGSGKTTLSRLVLRFYDPTEGRVVLDGEDLRDLDLQALRDSMAVVSQDPILFSGTIAENIRYGRLEATDEDVEAAARVAHADVFIREFPEGYETRVGERGVQLSGGQRQRVSIARAVLRNPRVLVLDEATSALDAQSEGLVQDALERLQAGRTTIIIAHRLSTVVHADRIVVLDRGRIVEEGRHTELLARKGAYAALVARQASVLGGINAG